MMRDCRGSAKFDWHRDLVPRSPIKLKIIPRARMASESIAHEAEGRMGY